MDATMTPMIRKALPVDLTEPELRAYGDEMARIWRALEETEERKKAAAAEFSAEIRGLRSEIQLLSRKISSRSEDRGVDCVERPDFARDVVDIVRLDTGEAVGSRPMTAADRQLSLVPDSPPARARSNARTNEPTNEGWDERSGEAAHERANVVAFERSQVGASVEAPRTLLRAPTRSNVRTQAPTYVGSPERSQAPTQEELDAMQVELDGMAADLEQSALHVNDE
jgi:hypothetical protein